MIERCSMKGGSATALFKMIGKTITGVEMKDDELFISFGSHGTLKLSDEGQSCCEHRYMTTDDKLEEYVGAALLNIEVKDVPIPILERKSYDDDDYSIDEHDIQFVEISTTKGSFVLVTHNEHNGYYGGFDVQLRLIAEGKS